MVAVGGTILYATLHGVTWEALAILAGLLLLVGMSVTAGYHRLFSHASYEAHPAVRIFYLLFGAAVFENSALKWAADHRLHHARVDGEDDPYSIRKGFWWAHVGWVFYKAPEVPRKRIGDLLKDPWVRLQDRFYVPLAILMGFGLPLGLGFLVGDPWGGLILGGFVRIVLLHHATFCINSVAHSIGRQPYSDRDSSRDSPLTALITLGEGYHNYHHTFPFDYRNGVRAYQFDPTKWLIRTLQASGLARRLVRVPGPVILRARARMDKARAEARLAEHPEATARIRTMHERLEALIAQWEAVKHRAAAVRAGLDHRSRDAARAVRRELRQARRRLAEMYLNWRLALRDPTAVSL